MSYVLKWRHVCVIHLKQDKLLLKKSVYNNKLTYDKKYMWSMNRQCLSLRNSEGLTISLFVLLSFLFWPWSCLSLDLRILITSLVSSNSSYKNVFFYITEGSVTVCHNKFSFLSSSTGLFMSPKFPKEYLNELECVYFFQAADRGRIKITFDLFNLEGPNSDQG